MSEFAADGVSRQIAATQTHPASLWVVTNGLK